MGLSAEEVERMVAEAEKFKAEDEANAARIQAKNGLENYCYSMKNSMNDEKLSGKISEEDKATVMAKVEETIKWIDSNQNGEKEEYEEKQREMKACAIQFYRRCTHKLVVLPAVCPVVCPVVCPAVCPVVCPAVCPVVCQVVCPVAWVLLQLRMMVPISKKLINKNYISRIYVAATNYK